MAWVYWFLHGFLEPLPSPLPLPLPLPLPFPFRLPNSTSLFPLRVVWVWCVGLSTCPRTSNSFCMMRLTPWGPTMPMPKSDSFFLPLRFCFCFCFERFWSPQSGAALFYSGEFDVRVSNFVYIVRLFIVVLNFEPFAFNF